MQSAVKLHVSGWVISALFPAIPPIVVDTPEVPAAEVTAALVPADGLTAGTTTEAVGAAEAFGAAEVIEAAGVIEAATCLLFVFVPFLVDESVELDLRNEEDPLVFLDTARYAMDKSRTSLVIEII